MEGTEIHYLGHSAILVTSCDGKKILIDPFLTENPLCPEEYKDPGPIDFIGLTHGHFDHTADVLTLSKKYNCKIFATYELANLLVSDGVSEGNIEYMNKGGTIKLPGTNKIRVTLTQASHSSSYKTSDGNTHYAGEACGILIQLEDGYSIYHAGDTCLFGDMLQIGNKFKPDLALLPIGDRFTMGPRDAAEAAKLIQAKKVIPIHWGTFEGLSGTPEEFRDLLEGSNSQFIDLPAGEKLSL